MVEMVEEKQDPSESAGSSTRMVFDTFTTNSLIVAHQKNYLWLFVAICGGRIKCLKWTN